MNLNNCNNFLKKISINAIRKLFKNFVDLNLSIALKKQFHRIYRRYFRLSFSLNYLDRKMQKYLDKENGYFIELGANNGVDQSNTYLLELKKN